jgi:hypothetical protein
MLLIGEVARFETLPRVFRGFLKIDSPFAALSLSRVYLTLTPLSTTLSLSPMKPTCPAPAVPVHGKVSTTPGMAVRDLVQR